MKIRMIGKTMVAIWTNDKDLGRKITARVGQIGAKYGRETASGEWRWSDVPGSKKVKFEEVGQLVPYIRLMRERK